jgi:hypothetical protein
MNKNNTVCRISNWFNCNPKFNVNYPVIGGDLFMRLNISILHLIVLIDHLRTFQAKRIPHAKPIDRNTLLYTIMNLYFGASNKLVLLY